MRLVRPLLLAFPFSFLPSVIPDVVAQSCTQPVSCGYYNQWNAQCLPPLPPGAFDCTGLDFTIYCKVRTNQCAPPKAHTEIPRCIECEKAAANAGKPINLANGDVYLDQVDVNVPGLGGGLRLVRSWNSLWPPTQSGYRTGMFGPNWRSNCEDRIFTGSDGFIKYAQGNGNFWSFGYHSSGTWLPAAPANAPAVLTQTSTNWVLTFKDGEQRLFDLNSGSLTSIVDRNGNTTTLSYDGMNRLVTVSDPASRHLSFTYASSSSYQVVGVSSDVGLSLTYSYDGNGRLLQVIKPDLSKWNFEYDSHPYLIPNIPNPFITTVKDQDGKVLESHTYDCYGRGLSSSRAGGVESVTVTYSDSSYAQCCNLGLRNSIPVIRGIALQA